MVAAVPLKLKDSADFQSFSSTDENYLAYKVGVKLADYDSSDLGALTLTSGGDTVGTLSDTYYNQAVGYGADGVPITSTTTTTTVYQNNGSVSITDSDYRIPVWQDSDDNQRIIREMNSSERNSLVDRINSRIFVSDYPGSYKLAASAPTADYQVAVSDVMTDTRTDGHSVQYNLYQRKTMAAPTTVLPFAIKRSAGSTGTYQGLQLMTNRQIEESLTPQARNRILTSKIGTYKIYPSTQTPTGAGLPGTWIAKGTATNTKNVTTDAQDYTRTRLSTYARQSISANFTRNFGRAQAVNFLRNSVEPDTFTTNYLNYVQITRTSVYSTGYVGNYLGNYSRDFVGNYARNRASQLDYAGNYLENFVGNYTRALSFLGNYVGPPDTPGGAYVTDYTRVSTKVSTYTRTTSADYIGNYSRFAQYARNYAGAYTKDFVEDYSRITDVDFSRDFEGNYSRDFEGNYSRDFSRTYFRDFIGNYGRDYEGAYSRDFEGNYSRAFEGGYSREFEGNYSRSFEGTYSRGFSRDYAGAYSRDYVGVYTRTFTGFSKGDFSRDFLGNYSRNFLGDFLGNYSRNFTGNFIGNYTRNFAGNFIGNYLSETSFTSSTEYIWTVNSGGTITVALVDVDPNDAAFKKTTLGSSIFYEYIFAGNSSTTSVTSQSGNVYYRGSFVQVDGNGNDQYDAYRVRKASGTVGFTRYYGAGDGPYVYTAYARAFNRTIAQSDYLRTSTRTRQSTYQRDRQTDYSRSYERYPTANFARNYEGAYARNFSVNYSRTRASQYEGNYSRAFEGNYARVFGVDFAGNYSRNYAGGYARDYVGAYSRDYLVVRSSTYAGLYSRNFEVTRSSGYTVTRTSNYLVTRTSTYAKIRTSSYAGQSPASTRNFVAQFTGDYIGIAETLNFTGEYSRQFGAAYTGTFTTEYTGNYGRNFTGNYTGTAITSSSETIETYTLYVRVS